MVILVGTIRRVGGWPSIEENRLGIVVAIKSDEILLLPI